MTDDAEWYAECRERQKKEHHEFIDRVEPLIQKKLAELEAAGHTIKKLTQWQYRIDGRWDIFWQSRRYHDIKLNVRGDYRDIMQFMHVKA